jgi:hypothetical protein
MMTATQKPIRTIVWIIDRPTASTTFSPVPAFVSVMRFDLKIRPRQMQDLLRAVSRF